MILHMYRIENAKRLLSYLASGRQLKQATINMTIFVNTNTFILYIKYQIYQEYITVYIMIIKSYINTIIKSRCT